MLRSLASKIFLSFAALVLAEALLLAYVFGKSEIRSTETYLLEALSNRVSSKAAAISEHPEYFRIFRSEESPDLLPSNFSRSDVLKLAPISGTSVSPCFDRFGKAFYCAFAFVPEGSLWSFDFASQETLLVAMLRRLEEVAPILVGLFVIAVLLSYFLSRFLLSPLKRFAHASEKIAAGAYDGVELPLNRHDEVGDLAQAFKKMISDLKDREANLQISGMKLAHSARLASLGQMGASIAHEVKNPLTSMMGYAKILMSRSQDAEIKEAAEIIHKECERCQQILQQMLKFSRNDPTESKPYLLKEVVQSVFLLLKSEARSRQIELRSEGLLDTIVTGSAQQIQQVLINLLMNAFHASKIGGAVTVRMKESGSRAILEVEDQGSGIPKEIQQKIFDPFFTTKGKQDGTGLGLSVAQEIVEQQGGELSVRSDEGRGAVFQIALKMS